MEYQGSLFFNFEAFKDTLIIVINNAKTATKIVKKGDFVAIYAEDELIGINIFNSNSYLKLRIGGLVHNPNEPLINLIHTLILSNLNENVVLVSSPVYLGQIKQINEKDFSVSLGDKDDIPALSLEKELNIDDYIIAVKRGTRLDNGNMAEDYLDAKHEYLIVGVETNVMDDAELGSETYQLKEEK